MTRLPALHMVSSTTSTDTCSRAGLSNQANIKTMYTLLYIRDPYTYMQAMLLYLPTHKYHNHVTQVVVFTTHPPGMYMNIGSAHTSYD